MIACLSQVQGLSVIVQRLGQDAALRIQAIELNVKTGQLLLQTQAGYRQVVGRGLNLRVTGGDLVADFAPQVQIEAQRKACGVAVVHRRLGAAAQRSVVRLALAQGLLAGGDLREQSGMQLAGIRLRRIEVREGRRKVRVGVEQALLQVVQALILISAPPLWRYAVTRLRTVPRAIAGLFAVVLRQVQHRRFVRRGQ